MSRTIKSRYGKKITIEQFGGDVSLAIEGKDDVLIHKEHAPAFALAILLAAGIDVDHESVGLSMAARHLRDADCLREAREKAEAVTKRRYELARDFGANPVYAPNSPWAKAIDRIIELESAS